MVVEILFVSLTQDQAELIYHNQSNLLILINGQPTTKRLIN